MVKRSTVEQVLFEWTIFSKSPFFKVSYFFKAVTFSQKLLFLIPVLFIIESFQSVKKPGVYRVVHPSQNFTFKCHDLFLTVAHTALPSLKKSYLKSFASNLFFQSSIERTISLKIKKNFEFNKNTNFSAESVKSHNSWLVIPQCYLFS